MKKYSLHIGLNETSLISNSSLNSPEANSRFYKKIAEENGFETIELLGENATSINLLNTLRAISKKITPDDIFFVTYCGHGFTINDISGEEDTHYDQIAILYDRYFIDDELKNCWSWFPENSKVVLITDCCYGGTLNKKAVSTSYIINASFNFHLTDVVPYLNSFQLHFKEFKEANILINHISSSQDRNIAKDSQVKDQLSPFTEAFEKVYNEGNFIGTFSHFFEEIKNEVEKTLPYNLPFIDRNIKNFLDEEFFLTKNLVLSQN
ncbi:caspase family protein [Chryseobacterium limigenitum]|uniref:Caspase domain-containing protein n=1 Tax=Chryseobacterium limigenitum TaxID=1612149 RepID=A0A1K2IEE9_9FLAO|nr:caspase family protein [Chryseobacterium limigenitum]SFZ90091.1 Caspase domain-containing protein [Chryseobacterium limigenitum]